MGHSASTLQRVSAIMAFAGTLCLWAAPSLAASDVELGMISAPSAHATTPQHITPTAKHRGHIQIAQDVTEKEAFELAKELGTVNGWRAFLIKFSTGFRAELARSYIEKLEGQGSALSTNANTKTPPASTPLSQLNNSNMPPRPGVAYIEARAIPGVYKIVARTNSDRYFNVNSGGKVGLSRNSLPRNSSRWQFRQVPGSIFVNIRNVYTGNLLYIDRGVPTVSPPVPWNDQRSHWALEQTYDGGGAVKIYHRLNRSFNQQAEAPGNAGHWLLLPENNNTPKTTRRTKRKKRVSSQSGIKIECRRGFYYYGDCRCYAGSKRVRIKGSRYKCVRAKKKIRTTKPRKPSQSSNNRCWAQCEAWCRANVPEGRGRDKCASDGCEKQCGLE